MTDEKKRAALAPWDQPLAAAGLQSFRLAGPFGWIMIGATDAQDAMRQAHRSTPAPQRERLQQWNGKAYVPCPT